MASAYRVNDFCAGTYAKYTPPHHKPPTPYFRVFCIFMYFHNARKLIPNGTAREIKTFRGELATLLKKKWVEKGGSYNFTYTQYVSNSQDSENSLRNVSSSSFGQFENDIIKFIAEWQPSATGGGWLDGYCNSFFYPFHIFTKKETNLSTDWILAKCNNPPPHIRNKINGVLLRL